MKYSKEEKNKYMLKLVTVAIMSCYEGNKDSDHLIEHPEEIKPGDYDMIGLPRKEVDMAREIINEFLGGTELDDDKKNTVRLLDFLVWVKDKYPDVVDEYNDFIEAKAKGLVVRKIIDKTHCMKCGKLVEITDTVLGVCLVCLRKHNPVKSNIGVRCFSCGKDFDVDGLWVDVRWFCSDGCRRDAVARGYVSDKIYLKGLK